MSESIFWLVSLRKMEVFSGFLFAVLAANFEFAACCKQKYTAHDCFHGNGPYGKIPTKKEPIRTLGFTSKLPCHVIIKQNTYNDAPCVPGLSYQPFF